MFTLNKCLVNYCNNHALSTFDQNGNLCSSDSYCLDHIPNPGKIKDDIYNYIAEKTQSSLVAAMNRQNNF